MNLRVASNAGNFGLADDLLASQERHRPMQLLLLLLCTLCVMSDNIWNTAVFGTDITVFSQ